MFLKLLFFVTYKNILTLLRSKTAMVREIRKLIKNSKSLLTLHDFLEYYCHHMGV